jgi:hypothetical protein
LKKGFLRIHEICNSSSQAPVNDSNKQPAYLKYVPIFKELFIRSVGSKINEDH